MNTAYAFRLPAGDWGVLDLVLAVEQCGLAGPWKKNGDIVVSDTPFRRPVPVKVWTEMQRLKPRLLELLRTTKQDGVSLEVVHP